MVMPARRTPRILVIEDDPSLNQQVTALLIRKGFQADQCFDGEAGLMSALSKHYDLILLDVLLPLLGGYELLDRLRQTRQTPVMMLTACGAEEERILGYRCGADDYMPKPFGFTELLLRIEALLRRTLGWDNNGVDPGELVVGPLQLRRADGSVTFGSVPLVLTPIQFRLLWMLVLNQGEPLSKPYLYQSVLERKFSRYDRSLDMHLSRVRRKLVAAGMAPDRLQTVHGKGYCFL